MLSLSYLYFVYSIIPSKYLSGHTSLFFDSWLNSITFLSHVAGGALALWLAPFVLISIKKNWSCSKTLIHWYLFFSLVIFLFWPLAFFMQCRGVSISLYLLISIEILSLFVLAKAYYYYRREDMTMFKTYFIYLYSFEMGPGYIRPMEIFFEKIYPFNENIHYFEFNPQNMALDISSFLAIASAIVLAKILIYSRVIDKY